MLWSQTSSMAVPIVHITLIPTTTQTYWPKRATLICRQPLIPCWNFGILPKPKVVTTSVTCRFPPTAVPLLLHCRHQPILETHPVMPQTNVFTKPAIQYGERETKPPEIRGGKKKYSNLKITKTPMCKSVSGSPPTDLLPKTAGILMTFIFTIINAPPQRHKTKRTSIYERQH